MFDVVCAIFYVLRSGCAWRLLPNDFPKWQTVYWYFNTWRKEKVWKSINDTLRVKLRKAIGKDEEPSAGIIDSQSVKTTDKGGLKGYDAGKKTKGRKRHIIVDTLGLLLGVVVHSAGIQDRDGAKLVFKKIKGIFFRLILIWADGGYAGKLIDWVKAQINLELKIIKRNTELKGFHILPKRWIVERTFAWFHKYRRLSKDYEYLTDTSENMLYIAMIHIMCRRLSLKKK
jgi:putative transposase